MIASILSTLVLVGLSSAQSTASIFFPAADPQSLVGSIAGSDSTQTTYVIQCPNGTDSSNCGFPTPQTIIQGPSTYQLVLSVDGGVNSVNCGLQGTTAAVCAASATMSGSTLLDTTTLNSSEITFMPVVITAGANASAKQTASTTGASPTASSTSGAPGSTSGSNTASKTAYASSSAATSNGGVMQRAASGVAAMGGTAALLAMAMAIF